MVSVAKRLDFYWLGGLDVFQSPQGGLTLHTLLSRIQATQKMAIHHPILGVIRGLPVKPFGSYTSNGGSCGAECPPDEGSA